ncbi:type II toxin-antitoxin system Phd/YefM family antitoxin [Oleomonas cavernae]|uniref:Antitoxin n=1 Tax=Oleomonas cavernae TaxID=2320859 RepID=A0A418VU96_9PROT|nr:type II toxin-antitoxin system Phd/YefM family antitoxin [Oleomonas cavernae]RJF80694.1 type II toxin-antitoxin system Phd/YefM family antitoxin [Oleomonas cavernae]
MAITVPATEFIRRPGRYKDAAKHEPIAVTSHGVPEVYLLSPAEYEHYRLLKRREREAFHLKELPEEFVRAILTAPIDPAFEAFNDEAP